MADFFISYAREDLKFVRDLHDSLTKDEKEVWVDWEDILPTAEWLQEIHSAIEAAHTFIFIISPASVASETCLQELSYAVELKRRLIPVVWHEVANELVPPALRPLQWVFFRSSDSFGHDLQTSKAVFYNNLDWLRMERRIGLRAAEWRRKGRDASLLLLGSELREAKEWLTQRAGDNLVTELHVEYVNASATAASAELSSRLADLSFQLLNNRHDLALLLALEATRAAETVKAQGSLLSAVQAHPHLDTWLRGPGGPITTVAFSVDGGLIAAGTTDGTIIIWGVAHRRMLALLKCRPSPIAFDHLTEIVDGLAFSADGKLLAAAISSGVIMWELVTGNQIGPMIEAGARPITSVAFSPDGSLLALAATNGQIRLLDLRAHSSSEQGVVFAPDALSQPLEGHTDGVSCVVFSPDGTTLASSSKDRTIRLWDVSKREPIGQPLARHYEWVPSIAFSPDGRRLVSGSLDGTIILWDVTTREPEGPPLIHDASGVMGVAFSRDGTILASTARNRTIALWDLDSRRQIIQLSGHDGIVSKVAFSPSADLLASGGSDGAVILWDVTMSSPLRVELTGHGERISHIECSPDGKLLATGAWDGRIILTDLSNIGQSSISLTHNQKITGFAFSPDGKILASSTFGPLVMLWDVATGQPLGEMSGHRGKIQSLAFSPDGNVLASSGWDGSVILWEVASRKSIRQLLIEKGGPVFSVAFSPDGETLAAGTHKAITLWHVVSGEPLDKSFSGHTDAVTSIAFHTGGKIFASGSVDKTIRLWDAAKGQPLGQPLAGASGIVYRVAFSPNGELLASAHGDGSISLWGLPSRERLGEFRGYSSSVYSVAFSPNSRLLVSGGCKEFDLVECHQGRIVLWDVWPESWKAKACRMANRNLSLDEWRSYFGDEAYRKTCPNLPGAED